LKLIFCNILSATATCFFFAFLKYNSLSFATISMSVQPFLFITAAPVSPPAGADCLSGIPVIIFLASFKNSLTSFTSALSNFGDINLASI